jgi:hypothetical protein
MKDPTSVRITLPMIYKQLQEIANKVDCQNARISKAVILGTTALSIALSLLAFILARSV